MLDIMSGYLQNHAGMEVARDVFDIFIVYYITYRLLLVARGTRAIQIAAGLGIVALFYVFAQALDLVTIVTLVGALLKSIILVIVVVFQNDIRRALQRVGSRAILGGARAQETQVIEQVVEAARELARHRIGAIIAFEQDANLDEFVGQNKGVDVDAKVSAELLVSLFVPEGSNKLHDGAVILRNLRVAKAGVFFPMPESRSLDSQYGSRHRAALGITEETDAVVVVVSEERGTISFCFNGNIAPDLQANQLREMLFSIMSPKAAVPPRKAVKKPAADTRESADRVTLASPPIRKSDEVVVPASSRASETGAQPKPLRKSALPDEPKPLEGDTDSINVPVATPRPMPKAADVDLKKDAIDDPSEESRRTPQ